MPVPDDQVSRFGIIAGQAISDDVWKIDSLVEKPALEDAPSNLAVFGRYLLSARVMELLADVEPGVGGEDLLRHSHGTCHVELLIPSGARPDPSSMETASF